MAKLIRQCKNFEKKFFSAVAKDAGDFETEWREAKPVDSIPGPKPLPIPFGNLWRFVVPHGTLGGYGGLDLIQIHNKIRKEYGPIAKLAGIGPKTMIALYDPDYIETMYRNEPVWPIRETFGSFAYFRDHVRNDVYKGCAGLVSSNGKEWHDFRSNVNQVMMQPKSAKAYVKPINGVSDDFIERIKLIRDSKLEMPKDFARELNKWSLESIGVVALDTRLGSLNKDLGPDSEAQRLISAVHDASDAMFKLDFLPSFWRYISTPTWKKFVKSGNILVDITQNRVMNKIEEIKQKSKNEDYEPSSVLEVLYSKDKNSLTAMIMAMDMLTAGVDTTASSVATALYFISKNPEKQQKLYEELKQYLPSKDTPLTSEILNELKYLKASIKESMRIAPIVPGNARTAAKDFIIGGYQIPKGTFVFALNIFLSNSEEYYKHADKFLPERWLKSEANSEISVKSASPFIFLPFGFGPRMCIGRRFAELEMEILLAKIVRNFKIEYNHGEMTWMPKLVNACNKPLQFKMEDRTE